VAEQRILFPCFVFLLFHKL